MKKICIEEFLRFRSWKDELVINSLKKQFKYHFCFSIGRIICSYTMISSRYFMWYTAKNHLLVILTVFKIVFERQQSKLSKTISLLKNNFKFVSCISTNLLIYCWGVWSIMTIIMYKIKIQYEDFRIFNNVFIFPWRWCMFKNRYSRITYLSYMYFES